MATEHRRQQQREAHQRNYQADPQKYHKQSNAWKAANPERWASIRRRSHWKRLGVNLVTVPAELPTTCAICGATGSLHLDHDHSTGVFRGMLCLQHNVLLGNAQDSPDTLEKAALYLRACKTKKPMIG